MNWEQLELSSDSDTTLFDLHLERLETFEIEPLTNSTSDYSWRIWSTTSLIQLDQSGNDVTGHVITMVISEDEQTKGEIWKQITDFPDSTAKRFMSLINNYKINSLPSDKLIEGWFQRGLDGVVYSIEQNIGKSYSFKHYWTPSSEYHGDLEEAQRVSDFIEEMFSLVNTIESVDSTPPFNAYRYFGTSHSVVRITDKKTKRKKRKNER